jgi:uncharacterized membrane protein HdeD (DUF308 family)
METTPTQSSWREGLAVTLLFLPAALGSLFDSLDYTPPRWSLYVLVYTWQVLLVASLIALILFALRRSRRLPRWALPYAGFLGILIGWGLMTRGTMGLLGVSFDTRAGILDSLLGWIDRLVDDALRCSSPWIVHVILGPGRAWIGLLVLTTLAIATTAVLRPLRPLHARLRADWTLLSFALYGATWTLPIATFDDYPADCKPYQCAMALILAAGALLYTRGSRPLHPALVLISAVTLSMMMAAASKPLICINRDNPHGTCVWQMELVATVGEWGLAMVVLLTPALLALLPGPDKA